MVGFAPDYQKVMGPMLAAAASQPQPPQNNVLEMRKVLDIFVATAFQDPPAPKDIIQTVHEVPVPATNKTVAVTRFATAEQAAATGQSAVIYLHPGGMVSGSVELLAATIANETAQTGVQHWAVEYSKSPDVTAPVAIEEGYAALQWLSTHAAEFGIDNTRIGIAGASAGGGLTASVGLLARDRGLAPPVAKLIMIYPMLDDRTVQAHPPKGARYPGAKADDDWAVRPFLLWTCEQNAMGWAAYLGVGNPATDDALTCAANLAKASAGRAAPGAGPAATYAVPARATSLAGMPSSYIDVGGLDLFAEESIQFAAQLARDQVDFELHIFKGVPHAFELAATTHSAKSALELRRAAFNSF